MKIRRCLSKIGNMRKGETVFPRYLEGYLERTESFQMFLKFDISNLNGDERQKLKSVFKNLHELNDGDTVSANYSFDILYFNGVALALSVILDLFDKATIKEVETRELTEDKALIQEVFIKLERIENKFKELNKEK